MGRCEGPPPDELLVAVGQFNRGEWFDCHETLEELWVGEKGELRDFYQGFLQLAVALHHWHNGNYKGAVSLLDRGGALLKRVRPLCQRIDVSALAAACGSLQQALEALGEERMEELATELVPTVRLVDVKKEDSPPPEGEG